MKEWNFALRIWDRFANIPERLSDDHSTVSPPSRLIERDMSDGSDSTPMASNHRVMLG